MKKLLTPVLTVLLASGGLVSAHTYDFTKWSDATVNNLKADAAAGKLKGWSDIEKQADADADKDAPEATKDNCFWMAADNSAIGEGGNLYANGVLIEELKGLDFSTAPATRNLAIAVNYSSALNDYQGPAYLWLGGSGKDYITLHNVKAGSTIKMMVESHKYADNDGRGVKLYTYSNGAKGAELLGTDGNAVAVPVTYAEQVWQVPAGDAPVDVMIYNTNGCHLYYIDVEQVSAQEPGQDNPGVDEQPYADALYYSDFYKWPAEYFAEYGDIADNTNIIEKGSTDVTAVKAGITYFSGIKGRVVAMKGSNNSSDPEKDYGPETDADLGASDRCVQLIDGGKALYMELPEVEGPVKLTLFVADGKGTEHTVVLTDENGDTNNPLLSIPLKNKKMKKVVYEYPYKGTVKLRLYNMGVNTNVNDVIIEKGEGEGIDKPVIKDETAPALTYSWPSKANYAPTSGIITLMFDEDIVVEGKAQVNGVACDVAVEGKTASIAYSGLENGKEYAVTLPVIKDEAGNVSEIPALSVNTIADNVLYYSDFAFFPYTYWQKHYNIPNAGGDNNDILAKNSTDLTAECGGITYYSGTNGRVVAMGKSNLLEDKSEEHAGASQRCIQISGGEGDLYAEMPEVQGPCDVTIYVGNSTEKATNFTLKNGDAADELATFEMPAEKKMFKHTYSYQGTDKLALRLYNNGNQFNVHDVLITKAVPTAISGIESSENVEAVYYNLQGVRVANPSNGVYVRVLGDKAEKVVIR